MTQLAVLAAAIAVIELDGTYIGQWMISRPIVLGPMVGILAGEIEAGVLLGALFEMFSAAAVPVGTHIPANATIGAGSALLLALGPGAAGLEWAFPVGLALAHAFRPLEGELRQRAERWEARAARRIEEEEPGGLGGILALGLVERLAVSAAFLMAVLFVLRPLLSRLACAAPEIVQAGLGWGLDAAPWLGVAALLQVLWKR